jgi:hypothetical protein
MKERKVQKHNFAQVSAEESSSVAQPAGAAATRPCCAHNVVYVCVCGAALGVLYEVKRNISVGSTPFRQSVSELGPAMTSSTRAVTCHDLQYQSWEQP